MTLGPSPPGIRGRGQRHGAGPPGLAGRGWAGRGRPGDSRPPLTAAPRAHAPHDPGGPSADPHPSPEEGVGAVVVDLGLRAAAARARPARSVRCRAVRRLLQRGLARGHRGPRPRPPGASALAPPHGARPAAPPRALTPRTAGHREGALRTARGAPGRGRGAASAGSRESWGGGRLGKGVLCIVGLVVRAPGPRGTLGVVVSDAAGQKQWLLGRMPPSC